MIVLALVGLWLIVMLFSKRNCNNQTLASADLSSRFVHSPAAKYGHAAVRSKTSSSCLEDTLLALLALPVPPILCLKGLGVGSGLYQVRRWDNSFPNMVLGEIQGMNATQK